MRVFYKIKQFIERILQTWGRIIFSFITGFTKTKRESSRKLNHFCSWNILTKVRNFLWELSSKLKVLQLEINLCKFQYLYNRIIPAEKYLPANI